MKRYRALVVNFDGGATRFEFDTYTEWTAFSRGFIVGLHAACDESDVFSEDDVGSLMDLIEDRECDGLSSLGEVRQEDIDWLENGDTSD